MKNEMSSILARLPLPPAELRDAARYGLYVLGQELLVQHHIDGGVVLPAGRFVCFPRQPLPLDDQFCYVSASEVIIVVDPHVYDVSSGLPEGFVYIRVPSEQKTYCCPPGHEALWLDICRQKSRNGRVQLAPSDFYTSR